MRAFELLAPTASALRPKFLFELQVKVFRLCDAYRALDAFKNRAIRAAAMRDCRTPSAD